MLSRGQIVYFENVLYTYAEIPIFLSAKIQYNSYLYTSYENYFIVRFSNGLIGELY